MLLQIKEEPFDPEFFHLTQQVFNKSITGHLFRGYSIIHNESGEMKREFEVMTIQVPISYRKSRLFPLISLLSVVVLPWI